MSLLTRISTLSLALLLAPQALASQAAMTDSVVSAPHVLAPTASDAPSTRRPVEAAAQRASQGDAAPSAWITLLIIAALVGHQLRRKHRLLRPQRFAERFNS